MRIDEDRVQLIGSWTILDLKTCLVGRTISGRNHSGSKKVHHEANALSPRCLEDEPEWRLAGSWLMDNATTCVAQAANHKLQQGLALAAGHLIGSEVVSTHGT
jgi:hypothetical protein